MSAHADLVAEVVAHLETFSDQALAAVCDTIVGDTDFVASLSADEALAVARMNARLAAARAALAGIDARQKRELRALFGRAAGSC